MNTYPKTTHIQFLNYLEQQKYLTHKDKEQFKTGLDILYADTDTVTGNLEDYVALTKEAQDEIGITVYVTKSTDSEPASGEVQDIVQNYLQKLEGIQPYTSTNLQPYVEQLRKHIPLTENVQIDLQTAKEQGKQHVSYRFYPELTQEDYEQLVDIDENKKQYIKNKSYLTTAVHGQPISLYLGRLRDRIFDILFDLRKSNKAVTVHHDYVVSPATDKSKEGIEVYYQIRFEMEESEITEQDYQRLMEQLLPQLAECII